MEDDFEEQFADEMDAMREFDDFDPEEHMPSFNTKSKKSLNFSTPSSQHAKSKKNVRNLNDSFPTPLDSPVSSRQGATSSADDSLESDKENKLDKEDKLNGQKVQREETLAGNRNNVKKRKKDDMYGNMSASDEEDNQTAEDLPTITPVSKRARKSPQVAVPDLVLDDDFDITPPPSPDQVELIKQRRSDQVALSVSTRAANFADRITRDYDFERIRVLRRIPRGDFIGITGMEGRRYYMGRKNEEQIKAELNSFGGGQNSLHLLGMPLAVLKAHIEEEQRKKVMEEARELSQLVHRLDGEETEVEEVYEPSEEVPTGPQQNLWVEKYSPRRYTDLLSDECTNRLLLKWLKLWDHVVFGREQALKNRAAFKKGGDKKMEKKGGDQSKTGSFKKFQPDVEEELDQYHRPMQKVALLCGPPGLGKTTLAHVLARHAGYNVVEMNASDDRQAEVFKTRIEAATQMKAVLGPDPRPNCLIIDEIDGAPQAAINVLLSMLKRPEGGTGKKKKKEGGMLLRPIICICNDLYVPALRQLRQQALVVTFPPTQAAKLAGRLLEVIRLESLRTDMTTLMALCEKADNDIRSCLNTLQFVHGRARQLTLHMVHSTSIGQKDAHKSLFTVMKDIFQMPKPQRKRYVNPYDRTDTTEMENLQAAMNAMNNTSGSARFQHVLDMVHAAGENEKLMQGLYENFLEAKVKDPRMEGVLAATEWLCFVDNINQQIAHTQNYIFMKYLPYLPIVFHFLFAANAPQRVQYPHMQYDAYIKLMKSTNLVTSMLNDVAPSVRKNLNVTVCVTEMLPPLMDIIQPTLRPVNTQLYSQREKAELAQLIKIMIAYNMTYHQERTMEGQYVYALEPNMEDVVRYPGQKQHRQLTYAAKQLIAREIELEKMRRSEAAIEATKEAIAARNMKRQEMSKKKEEEKVESKKPEIPNHLRQKLEPKAVSVVEAQTAVDFFGRTVTSHVIEQKKKKESKKEVIGGDIWFRFKEGFTNAVRRTVRIQDLQ